MSREESGVWSLESGVWSLESGVGRRESFTYWNVGRLIVDKERTEIYDDQGLRQMLLDISKELTRDLGKGFSRTNLFYMRSFFLNFPGVQTVSEQGNREPVQTLSKRIGKRETGESKTGQAKSVQGKNKKESIGLTVSHQLNWSHYSCHV